MHRSRLPKIFAKPKKLSDWENFKQRNYFVQLRNQARKACFIKLQNMDVVKKKFWKTKKSNDQSRKIIFKEQNEIISDECKVTEIFMDYFNNMTETIDLPKYDARHTAYVDINK